LRDLLLAIIELGFYIDRLTKI